VPTGFSTVDRATSIPSSTFQISGSQCQFSSVRPSKICFQPSWSFQSDGVGWEKPPPRPPRPGPAGAASGCVGVCWANAGRKMAAAIATWNNLTAPPLAA